MTDQRTRPHGVPCCIETEQPDQTEAGRFDGSLFGWTFEAAMPPGAPGSSVRHRTPARAAARLHVTFAVADRDEAVALGLGAVDLHGPIDSMWTRAAVIRNPQGAVFTLGQFTPPEA